MNIKNYLIPTKKYRILSSSFHSLYRLINSTFTLREFLIKFAKLICQIAKAEKASILLLDPEKKYSIIKVKSDKNSLKIIEKKVKIKKREEKRIINSGTIIRKKNILFLPLISDDVCGMACLSKKRKGFEKFDEELLMTICLQASIAIKNLELYEEQHHIINGVVKSLLALLESQFPAYSHSHCFFKIIEELAKRMNLSQENRQSLKYASLLHDMGKINIPPEIIKKSSALTNKEYGLIKQHPLKSAQILKHLKILKPAVPIIFHHHERFDGNGYPSRLKGRRIPLESRIMSVVDAFDAMVYGRPYKKKVDIETALEEIKKNSGSQFDPKVVQEFIKVVNTKKIKKYLKRI